MTNEQTQVERQVVYATYEASKVFKVPKEINLKDSDQVKEYGIRCDCLYIKLYEKHMEKWVDKYYKEDDRYVDIKDGIIGARQMQKGEIDGLLPGSSLNRLYLCRCKFFMRCTYYKQIYRSRGAGEYT